MTCHSALGLFARAKCLRIDRRAKNTGGSIAKGARQAPSFWPYLKAAVDVARDNRRPCAVGKHADTCFKGSYRPIARPGSLRKDEDFFPFLYKRAGKLKGAYIALSAKRVG